MKTIQLADCRGGSQYVEPELAPMEYMQLVPDLEGGVTTDDLVSVPQYGLPTQLMPTVSSWELLERYAWLYCESRYRPRDAWGRQRTIPDRHIRGRFSGIGGTNEYPGYRLVSEIEEVDEASRWLAENDRDRRLST